MMPRLHIIRSLAFSLSIGILILTTSGNASTEETIPHNTLDVLGEGTLDQWQVLGPFPNPNDPQRSWLQVGHSTDQLESIGGSANFRGHDADSLKVEFPELQTYP